MVDNLYLSRPDAKRALSIPVSATADDLTLDAVLYGVSRLIDDHVGFPLYAHQATKYFSACESECLTLPEPFTAITSVRTDVGGNASYDSTMSSTCYWPTGAGGDYNARSASPARPYWELHRRQNSSAVFPAGVERGVEITGTFGYTNQTRSLAGVIPSTAWVATATSLEANVASALYPGYTLLVDSEQIYVKDTGTASNLVNVDRGVNGTSAAAHTSATPISVYEYPVISEACRFQVSLTWRARDMSGYGGDNGVPARTPSGGSLHPFTRQALTMRAPVAK